MNWYLSRRNGSDNLNCFGQIDNRPLLRLGILHGIGRASVIGSQVADADTTVINQMAVTLKHAASIIVLSCINDLICLMQDLIPLV